MTETIHVRIVAQTAAVEHNERMLEAHRPHRDHDDEKQEHERVAHKLAIGHHLYEESQQGVSHQKRHRGGKQAFEIQPYFVIIVTHRGLHGHAHQNENQQNTRIKQQHGDKLSRQIDPVGNRQGIHDEIHVHCPLAPDELAGIEYDDDEKENVELAKQPQHVGRDRVGTRAVHFAKIERAHDQIDQPHAHDANERHIFQGGFGVENRLLPHHFQVTARSQDLLHQWNANAFGVEARFLGHAGLGLAPTLAHHAKTESEIGSRQNQQGDAHP